MDAEAQDRLGLGPRSLLYNKMKHNGFQQEYSKAVLAKMEDAQKTNMQEFLHDRYKKKAIEFWAYTFLSILTI